jgi:hypothetical protein
MNNICPICGKEGMIEHLPGSETRFILICSCNPAGPVMEMDAPAPEPEKQKKEKEK